MRLVLAHPRGFCAGVNRAVDIVEELLDLYHEPIFVRHEIIHNRAVCTELFRRGVIFVEEIDEVPEGSIIVLSAHGSPPRVYACAKRRKLRLFDATCPLVTKVHLEVARHARQRRAVVVIGHRDHVEVQGILGHYDNPDGDGAFVVESEAEAGRSSRHGSTASAASPRRPSRPIKPELSSRSWPRVFQASSFPMLRTFATPLRTARTRYVALPTSAV